MNFSEYEPEPSKEISPLRRYFSDVHYYHDRYFEMRTAIEKYVIASGAAADETAAGEMIDQWLPAYDEVEAGVGTDIHDILVTLPLVLVSQHVDAHMNLRDARAWYESMLVSIRTKMDSAHTTGCLDSAYFAFTPAQCSDHHAHCPVITTSKLLDQHIFDTEDEMNTGAYATDPLSVHEFLSMKQALAKEHGFVSPTVSDDRLEKYRQRFRSAMYALGER
jgi:hypothetical protein